MKFKYPVKYNGVVYRTGEDVPVLTKAVGVEGEQSNPGGGGSNAQPEPEKKAGQKPGKAAEK